MLNFSQELVRAVLHPSSLPMRELDERNYYPEGRTFHSFSILTHHPSHSLSQTAEKSRPILAGKAAKRKKYFLGGDYPDVYFTHQQTTCLAYFLQGMTTKETAKAMNLSQGVVSTHSCSMQRKLRCKNKKALLGKILCETSLFVHLKSLLPLELMDYIQEMLLTAVIDNQKNY